ncbi:MAG: type VI secretion system baseplate subunit TssF [Planctomycetes bacterium]|nr:type VI secretion system baseplate subunit TssF [Planctomycetota bacterium]
MHEELFPYYERELNYLRRFGAEFAGKYPDVASRLRLDPNRCDDPHVERLLEGFALLAGRIRRKIDDELPEITESLLSLLYPHYLAPVPPVGIAQFRIDPQAAKLTQKHTIEAGAVLRSRPVRGTTCRFRTCYPVTLWPFQVEKASLSRWEEHVTPEPRAQWRARSVLAIDLKTIGGLSFSSLGFDRVRFFLGAEPSVSYGLYEVLGSGAVRVEVTGGAVEGKSDASSSAFLSPEAIQPAGLGLDEGVIPYPSNSFLGYRLLQEFFVCPEKFLFLDFDLADAAAQIGAGDRLRIRVFLERMPDFWQDVDGKSFQPGCTPVINLFEKHAEPLIPDPTRLEQLILPDVQKREAYEVHSVAEVHATSIETGKTRRVEPFYSLRHVLRPEVPFYWTVRREPALDGATDCYLSLSTLAGRPAAVDEETLTIRLLCTNRDLVAQIRFQADPRGDFDLEKASQFGPVVAIVPPRRAVRTPMGREDEHWSSSKDDKYWRGGQWRLISHLALNHLSLEKRGLEALQSILQLYDYQESDATENMIRGLRGIETRPASRMFGGALCRGLAIELEIDESHFAGTSYYLFAAVLDRFFALYASVNSFTQLTVRSATSKRILKTWPPRAGEQVII